MDGGAVVLNVAYVTTLVPLAENRCHLPRFLRGGARWKYVFTSETIILFGGNRLCPFGTADKNRRDLENGSWLVLLPPPGSSSPASPSSVSTTVSTRLAFRPIDFGCEVDPAAACQVNRPRRKLAEYPGLRLEKGSYVLVREIEPANKPSSPVRETRFTPSKAGNFAAAVWRTYQERERWMALAFRSGYASLGLSARYT